MLLLTVFNVDAIFLVGQPQVVPHQLMEKHVVLLHKEYVDVLQLLKL
jgi:hypothetical protein